MSVRTFAMTRSRPSKAQLAESCRVFMASSISRRCSAIPVPASAARRSSSENKAVIWTFRSFLVSACARSANWCTSSRFLEAALARRLEPVHGGGARVFGERENRYRGGSQSNLPDNGLVCFAPTGPHARASPIRVRAMFAMRWEACPQRHSVGVSGEAHVECDLVEHHAHLAKSFGCFFRRPLHIRQESVLLVDATKTSQLSECRPP